MSDAIFVVFEGADLVGKTEQVSLLRKRFEAEGILVTHTSFPRYETKVGQALGRHLRGEISVVESDDTLEPSHVAPEDALFFEGLNCLDKMAGAEEIRAALSEGVSVISSRWWQSSVVYGKDAGQDGVFMRRVYSAMPQADVNFLLDVPLDVALSRRPDVRDRFDGDRDKQERVRASYLRMWQVGGAGEGWCRVLHGEGSAEEVHADVWAALLGHSKMQRLLAKHSSSVSAEERLARAREILSKHGNSFSMPEEDARELADLICGIARSSP